MNTGTTTRRHYRNRLLIVVVAAALLGLPCSPCSAAGVRIVYGAISATATPLWVAQDHGLFKKYGLDADLSHIPTTQAIQTLVAGGIHFSTGSSEILSAALAGGDAVYIAGLSNRFVLSIYGRPGLKSVADLRGKTVAATQPDGATAVGTRVLLRKEGMDPEKDIKFAYIRENPAILNALREGLVDAAALSPLTSLQARELGLVLIADITSLKIPFVHSALATQRSYAKSNADAVRGFLKAVVESLKICREQPATAQAVIAKYTKITNLKLAEEAYRGFLPSWERIPYVNRDALQALMDASANTKARTLKPEDFLDNSFLRELDNSGFVENLYK